MTRFETLVCVPLYRVRCVCLVCNNVLLEHRSLGQIHRRLLETLLDTLNGPKRPSFVSSIEVTELDIGESLPSIRNILVERSTSEDAAEMVRAQRKMGESITDQGEWTPNLRRISILMSITVAVHQSTCRPTSC